MPTASALPLPAERDASPLALLAGHYAVLGLALPEVRTAAPEDVPAPARALLTGTGGMTAGLEAVTGEPVGLTRLAVAAPGTAPSATRLVILRGRRTGRPLALGVLALDDAGLLPCRVRAGVEDGRIPFGTLLAEAGIAFVSRPGTLFAVTADAALRGWLEIGAAWEGSLHGRTARLRDGAGRPLARVLEILSPALQPVGSAVRR